MLSFSSVLSPCPHRRVELMVHEQRLATLALIILFRLYLIYIQHAKNTWMMHVKTVPERPWLPSWIIQLKCNDEYLNGAFPQVRRQLRLVAGGGARRPTGSAQYILAPGLRRRDKAAAKGQEIMTQTSGCQNSKNWNICPKVRNFQKKYLRFGTYVED